MNTKLQYKKVMEECSEIFNKKAEDYGTAWRILRTTSLTDQIFIKANRIRTIEQNKMSKVDEGIEPELIGIINYCIMGLIQLNIGIANHADIDAQKAGELYGVEFNNAFELMTNKNHDYGEAWRDMRLSSLTDLILMKLLRTKQIEDNDGETLISEGIDANYLDIINYAVFSLIRRAENNEVN